MGKKWAVAKLGERDGRAPRRVCRPTSFPTVTARAAPSIGRRPPWSCLLSTTASNARNGAGEDTDTGELARYVALVAAAAAVGAFGSDDASSSAMSVMYLILRFLSSDAPRPRPACIGRCVLHTTNMKVSQKDGSVSARARILVHISSSLQSRYPATSTAYQINLGSLAKLF